MTIERTHYIFGCVPVWRDRPSQDEPRFLKQIRDSEPDNLGYSFLGETISRSVVVNSADSITLYTFNPNRGPMDRDLFETLTRDQINRESVEGDAGCLGAIIGYKQRYTWRL